MGGCVGWGTLLWTQLCPTPPSLLPQVLKILLHLCGHGSSSFLLILKRNPAFIQEAAGMGQHCLQEAWEEGDQGRSRPEPLTRAPASLSHTRAPHSVLRPHCPSLPPPPFPSLCVSSSPPPHQARPAHCVEWLVSVRELCWAFAAWTFPVCPCLGFPLLPRAAPPDPRKPSILRRAGRWGTGLMRL